jgi:hypothetical protein
MAEYPYKFGRGLRVFLRRPITALAVVFLNVLSPFLARLIAHGSLSGLVSPFLNPAVRNWEMFILGVVVFGLGPFIIRVAYLFSRRY